jgi:FAD/FMN-containing dehydrogenase
VSSYTVPTDFPESDGTDSKEEANAQARRAMKALETDNAPSMKLYVEDEEQDKVWQVREAGLGATAFVPGEALTWEGWEDSAVPPEKVGSYLRALRQLYDSTALLCTAISARDAFIVGSILTS